MAGIQDFDRLPVPFRAIAADLETGEAAAPGSGDPGGALRASMSIPGLFLSVERCGRLLVDGGWPQLGVRESGMAEVIYPGRPP